MIINSENTCVNEKEETINTHTHTYTRERNTEVNKETMFGTLHRHNHNSAQQICNINIFISELFRITTSQQIK